MVSSLGRLFGGYAYSRRDLRLLYAAVFLSFLGSSITFPLRVLYARAHHANPLELGLMAGAFLLAPLLSQLPMGWLVDRWGRVPVLLLALIVHPILSILYIPLTSPVELISLRFLEGITVSAFQPAIGAYIADVTPEKHRSEAYGALGATLNAGMLLGPLFGGVLGQYFGFTAAYLVNFAIELLALPIVIGHVHEPRMHEVRPHEEGTWRALFSRSLIALYAGYFCLQMVMGTLSALWALLVHDLGGSYTYIGVTFSAFALPQIAFGAWAGRMADRRGRGLILIGSGLLAGLIYSSYGYIDNLWAIALLGLLEGFAIVCQTPVVSALLAEASPLQARGRAQGMAGAVGAIGGSVAAVVSVPLYHADRPAPFVGTGAVMVIGAIIAAGASVGLRRRRSARAESEALTA